MKIKGFRIRNYKSIRDTHDPSGAGYCELAKDITILAGKNEAGKTAILEALRDFGQDGPIPEDAIPIDHDGKPEITVFFDEFEDDLDAVLRGATGNNEREILRDYPEADFAITKNLDGSLALTEEWQHWVEKSVLRLSPLRDSFVDAFAFWTGTDSAALPSESLHRLYTDNPMKFLAGARVLAPRRAESGQFGLGSLVTHADTAQQMEQEIDGAKRAATDFAETIRTPVICILEDTSEGASPLVRVSEAGGNELWWRLQYLSGTDLSSEKLAEASGQEKRTIERRLEGPVLRAMRKLEHWSKLSPDFRLDDGKVELHVVEEEVDAVFLPSQRSRGVQHSLQLIIWLVAEVEGSLAVLDEPDLHLHPTAQKDLLELLVEFSKRYQVLLATHSPYLIDPDRLDRVRLVTKGEDGTRISKGFHTSGRRNEGNKDALTPVRSAIGLKLCHGLTAVDKDTVITEGMTDYLYLMAMKHVLRIEGDFAVAPCVGADNEPSVASILTGWGIRFVMLLDNDQKGRAVARKAKEKLLVEDSHIVLVPSHVEGRIEDMFSDEDIDKERVKEEKEIVAQEFFNAATADPPTIEISDQTKDNFRELFARIEEAFAASDDDEAATP